MGADRGQIGVMLASRRAVTLGALFARLSSEKDVRLLAAAPHEPAQLPAGPAFQPPDVVVLDDVLLHAPWMRRLRQRHPRPRVLLWCEQATDGLIKTILSHRLHGFVLARDTPDTVLNAVRAVCRGELWLPRAVLSDVILRGAVPPRADEDASCGVGHALVDAFGALTHREAEVVARLRHGYTNKEIGRELGIMEDTVKKHLKSVFAKLGVHRRGLVMLGHAPASLDDR